MKIKILSLLCLSLCFGPESESSSHEGPEFGQFYHTVDGEALVLDLTMWAEVSITIYGQFSTEQLPATERFAALFSKYPKPIYVPYVVQYFESIIEDDYRYTQPLIDSISKCKIGFTYFHPNHFEINGIKYSPNIAYQLTRSAEGSGHDLRQILYKILLLFRYKPREHFHKEVNQAWINEILKAPNSWLLEGPVVNEVGDVVL